jgi:hypothetical protein
MLEILNQPSPLNLEYSKRVKQLLIITIFVFVFFIVYKPFGLNNETFINCIKMSAYYGAVGLVIGIINVIVIPFILPGLFKEISWTLKRNIAWGFWNLFSFASFIFLAHNIYYHFYNFTIQAYLLSFYYVFILGFPLSLISSILYQNYLLKKHQRIAETLNKNLSVEGQPFSEEHVEFVINKSKRVHIPIHKLLYIEAVGNYISVVYDSNGIKKIIVRETIGNMEQKTCTSQNIVRVHRSYLVNLHYIMKIASDSQGLKIHLKEIDNIIPVSRSNIKNFNELISKNK